MVGGICEATGESMSQRLSTVSPIDQRVYVERALADQRAIDETLARAKAAQAAWRRCDLHTRARICHAAVDAFVAQTAEIAQEITWQMGRPIRYSAGEVRGYAERARYMIDIAPQALHRIDVGEKTGFERYIVREPLGTVFVIAPWNYPYLTAVNSVIPALMAGNTVVLKHSAQTPLCAERMVESFESVGIPSGVFQFLHLTHDDTQAVAASEAINFVAFTGSVAGGEAIERALAGTFKGAGLELGGKDPAYVRHDADLDAAVETTIDGAFFNSGQSCCGIERIYVHESVYEAYVAKAKLAVESYVLGRPDHESTTLGPLVRTSAANFVRGQIREAIEQGAVSLVDPAGFAMNEEGTPYLAPHLLTHVNHSMRIMHEETFGPVVGIEKVASDEEAIAKMNESQYGLTACVFTRDIDAGVAIGNRLEAGTFFINRCDYLDPALAWTGVKKSGRGCTLSICGYEQLTRLKSFHLKLPQE
jgi:acyl-CoA reductase-like NAD-dependent aldehyde dehydrogenase